MRISNVAISHYPVIKEQDFRPKIVEREYVFQLQYNTWIF